MKNISFALVLFFCSLLTIAQSPDKWYKVFTGKAGNLVTTMHLYKAGEIYSGYTWFEQNQTPMQIHGAYPVAKSDSIMISAGSGTVSLVLTGILTPTGFKGNSQLIKEGSQDKFAPFELQISTDKVYSPFSYFFTEATDSMPAQYKNYSRLSYFISSVWPAGNKPLDESIKKFIRTSLGMKPPPVETGKFIVDAKNKVLKDWKAYYVKLTPKQTPDLGLSLSHWEENKILVMHENEKFISLAYYNFLEAGGAAHGNFNTTVASFNKQTGKQIQLTDVLTTQGINLLSSILDQVARIMYNAKNNKPLDQNGFLVKKIIPTKNMYVTGSGIGFMYAPYEIKPFSDGEINLLVPFTALKPFMLPGFQ